MSIYLHISVFLPGGVPDELREVYYTGSSEASGDESRVSHKSPTDPLHFVPLIEGILWWTRQLWRKWAFAPAPTAAGPPRVKVVGRTQWQRSHRQRQR